MKYILKDIEKMRNKKMHAYTEWIKWKPFITIEKGFYIIESKINRGNCPLKLKPKQNEMH